MGGIVKPSVSKIKEKKENKILELCKKLLISLIIAVIITAPLSLAPLSFIASSQRVGGLNPMKILILGILPTIALACATLAVLSYLASLSTRLGDKTKDKARCWASYILWAGIILFISAVIAPLFFGVFEPSYPSMHSLTDASFECPGLTEYRPNMTNAHYYVVGTGVFRNFENEAGYICGNVSVIDENDVIIGQQDACCSGEIPPHGTGSCGIEVDIGSSNKTYKLVRCEKSLLIAMASQIAKPVIYLYPEKSMPVRVTVEMLNGHFTKTDPQIDERNGWDVIANPNGKIMQNGKQYPYLFYEADAVVYTRGNEDWVVRGDNISKWFDKMLPKMSLNEKEKKDFTDYWNQNLPEANYYRIRLLSQPELNRTVKLNIQPKPDTVIRVILVIEKLDGPVEIAEQKIITPERKGFTVVEWGVILE